MRVSITFLVSNNLISADALLSQLLIPIIFLYTQPIGLNRYTIGDESLKLQSPSKNDGTIDSNTCEE